MSLKETRPRSAFSLLYFATHEFEVSLNSATAVATLGSFLSITIVVLTLLITSSVSFMYSSSEEASAGLRGTSHVVAVMMDKNSRRRGWVAAAVEVVVGGVRVAAMVVVGLGLMGVSDFTDLGVISVGEAMMM